MSGPRKSGGAPFLEVSALNYTRAAAVLVVATILSTYGIYVSKGGDPFLPTISNTWDTAPGTFVSRWVVGNACDMFAVVQVMLYATSNDAIAWRRAMLVVGLVAVFCLSVVGAICDSPNPDCKGNDLIHSCFAVTFFVLYDLKMLVVSRRAGEAGGLRLGLASTACTLLRVAVPLVAVDVGRTSAWALACFEWANVGAIAAWTVREVARTCDDASWALGDVACAYSISGKQACACCGALYVGTLALSVAAGYAFGYLPVAEGVLFFISDMWPKIPGNWLSRWAVVQGAHVGIVAHVSFYYATPATSTLRRTGLAVAVVALLGLSIVGVCDEDENFALHVFGALVWFAGYDLFIALALAGDRLQPRETTRWRPVRDGVGVVALVLGLRRAARVVRAPFAPCAGAAPSPLCSLPALAEWSDALVIIAFMMLDGAAHPGDADCHDGVRVTARALAAPLLAKV